MSFSLNEMNQKLDAMQVIVKLSSVFESIASLHIAQIRNQVLQSQDFFSELWHIYTQIRAGDSFRFGRVSNRTEIDKELFVAITAAGGLSGDIDQKLINWMLTQYDPKKHDIIVIGHHGALQLMQQDIQFKKYFELPESDKNINVMPIVAEIQRYRSSTAYYQTYVSLMIQDVKKLELSRAVQQQGSQAEKSKKEDVISEASYIFEPSTQAVVGHLERSMLNIMLEQIILESKLAQYASRFRAMSAAHKKADDYFSDLKGDFSHIKRTQTDERLKEVIYSIKGRQGLPTGRQGRPPK